MATFYNQATLSYSGGTVNSNITTGEILEVLSATKTAVIGEYSQGSEVPYVINIINSGNTDFTDLTVTDNLGAYEFDSAEKQPLEYVENSVKYFADGVLLATPAVTAGPPLEISGITVPANGEATIIYVARVNGFAPPTAAGTIENTAVISGGITEITVTACITAAAEPVLGITKSVSPATVSENGELTYTFVIKNTGNTAAEAEDNVVVTDLFDPALSNITVAYNGETWASPANYSYDETTGQFATASGGITVPAATFTQDPSTGEWITEPGTATLTVTGTI